MIVEPNGGINKQFILELLSNGSLTTYFQPIVSSKDGAVYGYEALARIKQSNGSVNIGELFKKAILTNTISSLDIRCRENAISIASSFGINHINAYLFINVYPEALANLDHNIEITDDLAKRFEIPREKIIIEVTEEGIVYNYDSFKAVVMCYKKKGYKIAIDDFGAGYGGLKILSMVEPDFVKIDRYFISNMDKSVTDFNIVSSIVSICHKIGSNVIAEGVEQKKELEMAMDMGITLLQGYYLHKPSPTFVNGKFL